MEGVGQGAGLLISQVLKYEAPGAVIQVQPTNAWKAFKETCALLAFVLKSASSSF